MTAKLDLLRWWYPDDERTVPREYPDFPRQSSTVSL